MDDAASYICRTCGHLRLAKRGTHPAILGECSWEPEIAPEWLKDWLETDDRYGPRRTRFLDGPPVIDCNAWSYKQEPEKARFREYPARKSNDG